MDAQQLNDIFQQSLIRASEDKEQRKIKHQEFLARLRDSVERFKEQLREEIEYNLCETAKSSKKKCRFQSKYSFSDPFGNVKISTLVYGWYNRNTKTLNINGFQELGMTMTPFDELVKEFEQKEIYVSNISDRNRSFGFWISAQF